MWSIICHVKYLVTLLQYHAYKSLTFEAPSAGNLLGCLSIDFIVLLSSVSITTLISLSKSISSSFFDSEFFFDFFSLNLSVWLFLITGSFLLSSIDTDDEDKSSEFIVSSIGKLSVVLIKFVFSSTELERLAEKLLISTIVWCLW